jgi:hypothetical protein
MHEACVLGKGFVTGCDRQAELGVEHGKQLCLVWEVGMQGVEQGCEGQGDVEEANSYDSGVVR